MSVRTVLIVYVLVAIVAGSLEYFHSPKVVNDIEYTHYENFKIFKNSFTHLINDQNLYAAFPEETWDYYKYSPTFAVFMAPFTILPDIIGLSIWNLLNALLLFWAVWSMPGLKERKRIFLLWFILLELLTSIQNSQSNGLMAALMILTFNAFENKKGFLAALFIGLSLYLKLFGGVLVILSLFYPNRLKFTMYFFLWIIVLLVLPLLFISPDQLIFLYKSWFNLLQTDHTGSVGLSVMGWLDAWFGLIVSKNILLLIGIILLLTPVINIKAKHDFHYRLFYLASILIWVVIFNHKAESPTFIIAICGIALWYFSRRRRIALNDILIILAFILISLSPTDLFPAFLRKNYVIPYVLKAVPAILIWGTLQFQLYKKIECLPSQ